MRVLISGASMAGLSAAYWFSRTGADVTVVERADGLRLGGAPIDVRGDALGTAARMGVLEEIDRRRVTTPGPRPVLDERGEQTATMDLTWFANESTDDIEISRDDLNAILLEAVDDSATFVFDDSIATLVDDPAHDAAHVKLAGGHAGDFDLVVGADGLHSSVRRLAFGPERDFLRHMGLYVALLDLDAGTGWERGSFCVPGLTVTVRSELQRPLAYVVFRSPELHYDFRDQPAQRAIVVRRLSEIDVWQVPAVRDAFADPHSQGFYFDSLSQTLMPHWGRGRTALVGDAAHCASLLSGMGTSLAMTAAEHLATSVAELPGDLTRAYRRYEELQRPIVDKAQASVEGGHSEMMVPSTTTRLASRNETLRRLAKEHSAAG